MTRYAQALNQDLDTYAAFWQIAHEDAPAKIPAPRCYYPRGKQEMSGEWVEPFNVQADWEERS